MVGEGELGEMVGVWMIGGDVREVIGEGGGMMNGEMRGDMGEDFMGGHGSLWERLDEGVLRRMGVGVDG